MIEINKPRRKKRIILKAVALVLGTIATIIILMHHQIGDYLTIKSTEVLSKTLNIKITAQKIQGNIFSGLTFSDVTIRLQSGDSLYANAIKAEYNLMSIIFRKRNNIRALKIIKPAIYLYSKEPQSKPVSEPNLKFAFPLLVINHLEIRNGALYFNNSVILDTFSIIANIRLNPQGAHCSIEHTSFYIPSQTLQIENIQGVVNLSNAIARLQKLQIKTAKSQVSLDGQVEFDKKTLTLEIKSTQLNLSEFTNQTGLVKINGAVIAGPLNDTNWQLSNIKGSLAYSLADLDIQNTLIPDGSGRIDFIDTIIKTVYQLESDTALQEPQLNIDAEYIPRRKTFKGIASFVDFQFPISDLPMPITGNLDFTGTAFDSINFNLLASSKNPAIETISAQAIISGHGKLTIKNLRLKDRTNILDANGYFENFNGRKSFGCNIKVTNFSLRLASEIIQHFQAEELSLAGFVSGNSTIQYQDNKLSANGNIRVRQGAFSDFSGSSLKLHYNIENTDKLSGNFSLTAESLKWHDHDLTHLEFFYNNETISLKAINWKENNFIGFGQLHYDNKEFICSLDTLEIIGPTYNFTNTKPFSLGLTNHQLYLNDFSLAIDKGTIALDLMTNTTGHPKVNLTCNQVDLQNISSFFQLPASIDGILNLEVSNTGQLPDYAITLSASDLVVPLALLKKNGNHSRTTNNSNINLKSIESSAKLSDSMLKIDKMDIVYNQDTSKIIGTIATNHQAFIDNPLDLNVTFNDPGAWVLFFLKNVVDLQQGNLHGQGRLTGTLDKPNLSGGITISDARLLIVPTKTLCENARAKLSFQGRKIILDSLSGSVGSGKINANGFTTLVNFSNVESVSYKVECQNAPLRPQKEVYAIVNGNIDIDYKPLPKTTHSSDFLSITGNIAVKEALLTFEFEAPTTVSSTPDQNTFFNITVTGERDIWLRNQYCDVELSADLNITRTGQEMMYTGRLNAIQGNFYYLDHTLKLTRGVISFDNITELNPNFDIVAEMMTRRIQVRPDQSEQVNIILSLGGTLKEPVFTFTSDPPYLTENDIISYLTFNVTWQEVTAPQSREYLTAALSEKLFGYFERELTKRIRSLIYLDYLWIESGLISGTGAKVRVGKYVGPHFYFTYEYNLSKTANDIFQLEYYITKTHEIIGERDYDGRYNLKYQYKIRY